MPELPEVETVARHLRKTVVGERVVGVEILDERFAELKERHELVGRRVERVDRRGKYLSMLLDDGWVLQIHLMMAGRLLVRPARWEEDRFLRLLVRMEGGLEVRFCDMRRFGRAGLMDAAEYRAFGRRLGPEPAFGRIHGGAIAAGDGGEKDGTEERAAESETNRGDRKYLRG